MQLQNKNVLLISPEPWDHIFVSKHHYATHLAQRGNVVFFLNPPYEKDEINKTDFEGVFTVSYSGFPKGLRFYPRFIQRYFTRKRFHSLQHLCKVKFDVVWSFDNSVFFDFSALPKDVLKISHIVDLNQDFQTERAASTADYCFCTTELIKEKLINFNDKVYKINHGFNQQMDPVVTIILPGNSNVKALYAGNLAMPFIDWVMLHKVIVKNPAIDFIFVGPNKDSSMVDRQQNKSKQDIIGLTNSFFIGKVSSNDILRYQLAADILLVAYQEKCHSDQANPHKLMEYLGSGKMIVATNTSEYKAVAEKRLILMSNSNSEFNALFDLAISQLDDWNSEANQANRMSYALDNTYDKQISRIEDLLTNL